MKLIAVGSNIDPGVHVPNALTTLRQIVPLVAVSPFTLTAPIDRPDQDDYWNGVVAIIWEQPRSELEGILREIELQEGRERSDDPYESRTLDLDIIWWQDWVDDDVTRRAFLRDGVLHVNPDAVLPNGRKLVDVHVLEHPSGAVVYEPSWV